MSISGVSHSGIPLRWPSSIPHRTSGRGREARDDAGGQHPAEAGRPATAGRARRVAAPRPRQTASRRCRRESGRPRASRSLGATRARPTTPVQVPSVGLSTCRIAPGKCVLGARSASCSACWSRRARTGFNRRPRRAAGEVAKPSERVGLQAPAAASPPAAPSSSVLRSTKRPPRPSASGRPSPCWDSIIRRVHGPRSLDSVVARPPWARRVTPSVLIATVSRCTPRTTIESPGSAASTAPRIEPPPPATKRRPRAEPVKTIQLVASTTGTANSRADRRTRLPIALENRPRLSNNQRTKQAANPSRPQNVARTQTRAGAQAQPPASHGRAHGGGAGCCLETQHAEETSLARFMCAAGGAATRAPPLSGQGDDLDLI